MELLNKKILNSDNYSYLCSFFKDGQNNSISLYLDFKTKLMNFAKEVMETYIEKTTYKNNMCLCICINDLDSYASYIADVNAILLREDLVKKMYEKKDFTLLSVLFHELNHFKFKYDIKLGYFDEGLLRILKEELISNSSPFPSFIKTNEKNTYYKDNYENYTEEILANLYSLENLLVFLKSARIPITKNQKYQIDYVSKKYARQYDNFYRDVSSNMNFNSYTIDFEEAFDILVKDNPSWVKDYPQLKIEYYIDETGKVRKKDIEQLKSLLNIETNPQIKEYLERVINNSIEKHNFSSKKKSILNTKITKINKSNY